jgi:hypothetical protein
MNLLIAQRRRHYDIPVVRCHTRVRVCLFLAAVMSRAATVFLCPKLIQLTTYSTHGDTVY